MVARKARRAPRRPRRAPRRGGRVSKRTTKKKALNPMSQYAKIVESVELTDLKSDTPYQEVFLLSDFFRATTLAKNFQFYKAVKVKWEYMPLYNTFQQSNSVAVVSKPQMYFIMNRDQDPYWSQRTAFDARFSIVSQGTDPISFTSNKEIIYKPNWCSSGVTALTFGSAVSGIDPTKTIQAVTNVISLGLKKNFGWLPTPNADLFLKPEVYNPTTAPTGAAGTLNTGPTANAGVIYNGHNLYIEQENEPDVPVCKRVLTVEWLFKGPKNNYNTHA